MSFLTDSLSGMFNEIKNTFTGTVGETSVEGTHPVLDFIGNAFSKFCEITDGLGDEINLTGIAISAALAVLFPEA